MPPPVGQCVFIACVVLLIIVVMLSFNDVTRFSQEETSVQRVPATVLPPGLILMNERVQVPEISSRPIKQAETIFYLFVEFNGVLCNTVVRQGRAGDGGWDLCVVEPFRPKPGCLVYSFGINFDWTFDDEVSKGYNCQVFSFDPSIGKKPVRDYSNQLVKFNPWGLSGKDFTNDKGWELYTLGTIIKKLGHGNRTIDYLKMDIEYSEWDAMESILRDNLLTNVKQLGIEIHSGFLGFKNKTDTAQSYQRYVDILYGIETAGFKRFSSHTNHYGIHTSTTRGLKVPCCWEFAYINMNFVTTD